MKTVNVNFSVKKKQVTVKMDRQIYHEAPAGPAGRLEASAILGSDPENMYSMISRA